MPKKLTIPVNQRITAQPGLVHRVKQAFTALIVLTALTACAGVAQGAGPRPIVIDIATRGDALAFDKAVLRAPAHSLVTLRFRNTAHSPSMRHTAVVVAPSDADGVRADALATSDPDTWLQPNDPRVLVATSVIRAGNIGEVSFTTGEPGEYSLICTYPGHDAMVIPVIVK